MLKSSTENQPEKENMTALKIQSDAYSGAKQCDVDKSEPFEVDILSKAVQKIKSLHQVVNIRNGRSVEDVPGSKNEGKVETKENDAQDFQKKEWKLKDFTIEHRLGHGQFGKVYLVREKSTKYAYAMKKQVRDATTEILVWREIGIQRELCHRNILRFYNYFYDDKKLYMILEHAPNGNLLKRMYKQPEKRFDEKCAAGYILSCANALIYLHERDIIHRDIKPENILLGYNDEVKIADFGLSVNAQNQRRTTICGTPDYIPPEIMNGESYTKAVDIWSLGVLCYDLLIGEWAFKSETKKDQYWKAVKGNYNPFPDFLSKTAGHLIRRLIVVDPEHRLPLEDVPKHPWIVANTK